MSKYGGEDWWKQHYFLKHFIVALQYLWTYRVARSGTQIHILGEIYPIAPNVAHAMGAVDWGLGAKYGIETADLEPMVDLCN